MTRNSRSACQSGDGYFLSCLLKSLWQSPIKAMTKVPNSKISLTTASADKFSVLLPSRFWWMHIGHHLLLSGSHHRLHFSTMFIIRLLEGIWKNETELMFAKFKTARVNGRFPILFIFQKRSHLNHRLFLASHRPHTEQLSHIFFLHQSK